MMSAFMSTGTGGLELYCPSAVDNEDGTLLEDLGSALHETSLLAYASRAYLVIILDGFSEGFHCGYLEH